MKRRALILVVSVVVMFVLTTIASAQHPRTFKAATGGASLSAKAQ